MPYRFLFLSVLLILKFQALLAQETPKTLLWKITGNNLSKPCYLYGTMHTKDKRAYYLGDSVYKSIASCDGFAMEIDPGETIDTVVAQRENEKLDIAYRQAVENDLVKRGADYYKKNAKEFDSVLTRMRKRFVDMSLRDINRLERAYRRRMRNDMRTRLDLYLFDLAKRQGKIMGAVEDIPDQLSLKNEKGKVFDEELFLKQQKGKHADLEEWMIETYAEAELDKLNGFSIASNSPRMLSLMLYNRNDKMARRIDSLGHIRSSFCAVGAGHLPGDSGVIALLRKRGFTVVPVFSSKTIEPGDIVIENKLQTVMEVWDTDSNYVVQMPGRPTDLTSITRKLFVKTYKELSNEILLMSGVYEDGKTYKTVDKEVEELKSFFSRYDIKVYDTKKISRQNIDGYEVKYKSKDGHIRLHIFCNKGKIFMFAAGSMDKDSLYSTRCENYLASYRMMLDRKLVETSMVNFVCPEKAFSIQMPVLPKKENVKGDDTYTNEDVTLFSSIDSKRKMNYMVMLKEPFKGFFPGMDSSIFIQTTSEVTKAGIKKYTDEENILLDGYPALKLKVVVEADNKKQAIYLVMAFRQHRFYAISARGLAIPENDTLTNKFISSFRFLPYLQPTIAERASENNLFTVSAVSPLYIMPGNASQVKKDSLVPDRRKVEYYSFDSSTATSYAITSLGLGKYYWVENEQGFLKQYGDVFFNSALAVNNKFNNDSLIYNKTVKNGKIEGRELLIKRLGNNACLRLRYMQYADSAFVINMQGDSGMVTNETADIFFNSFKFTTEDFQTAVFDSKTEKMIKALMGNDSMARANAADELKRGFAFPEKDLPLMLAGLINDYNVPAINIDIPWLMAEAIMPHTGAAATAFIKKNYPLLKGKKENVRMLMFNILSATKSEEAYQMMKEYLLNDLPSPSHFETALTNFKQSTHLATAFFPDIIIKMKDSYLAPVIMDIASMLIDSNKLQYNIIKPYEEELTAIAKKMVNQYSENSADGFYLPHTDAVLKLLVQMNNKKSNGLLNDFLDLKNYDLSLVIILEKIKHGQEVTENVIEGFSEMPDKRIELYDELWKLKKQNYFIGKYANQRAFAEAFASLYTNNQISARVPKDYYVVAEREAIVNGVTNRYYIIKVKCFYSYENQLYTGIIGPFAIDKNILSIESGKEKYILYRSKYEFENIDSLFSDFIIKVQKMKN